MKNDNEMLADMPVSSAFFRLAIPAVAAQIINILYNLVDKMFIGRIPGVGKQALAGVGVAAPVILAISGFAALVSMGGAPKASIFMGKGDNEQIERKVLIIDGMTCINCQNRIEQTLKNTAGIFKANVSYSRGLAEIEFDSEILTLNRIITVIQELGYTVTYKKQRNYLKPVKTIGTFAIIILLYYLLQRLGILNLLVPSRLADSKMSYGMLFIVGLLTSVHCITMCGGINLPQCIPSGISSQENISKAKIIMPSFLYNAGRVISYSVIGFLLGGIGMLLTGGSEVGVPLLLQGILKISAGLFMVIMGINMLGIFPFLRRLQIRFPKKSVIKINQKKITEKRPFFVGLLNGLMPCGPMQSMQIIALGSGNPVLGATAMLMFSLGTVPLMLGLGSLVSALGKKYTKAVMQTGCILVVVLGLAMFCRERGC